MKRAVAIRHVPFEDLGSFAPVLRDNGFEIQYIDCGVDDIAKLDVLSPELMVVLGGPIGAYEEDHYPFITDEVRLLEQRLKAERATLGICLGAQIIARALGARVYPGAHKEIGWSSLTLTEAGRKSPLNHLTAPVLHWHGDTFDIPDNATPLASTDKCMNQAFSWGNKVLALQFHPEVAERNIEQWFIGHACEIAATDGISVPKLREDTSQFVGELQVQARECLKDWLKQAFGNETSIASCQNGSTREPHRL